MQIKPAAQAARMRDRHNILAPVCSGAVRRFTNALTGALRTCVNGPSASMLRFKCTHIGQKRIDFFRMGHGYQMPAPADKTIGIARIGYDHVVGSVDSFHRHIIQPIWPPIQNRARCPIEQAPVRIGQHFGKQFPMGSFPSAKAKCKQLSE